MIGQIILITYIILASTVGAWWLASNDIHKKEITLLDVLGHMMPAIVICWILIPMYYLDKVKVPFLRKLDKVKIKKIK